MSLALFILLAVFVFLVLIGQQLKHRPKDDGNNQNNQRDFDQHEAVWVAQEAMAKWIHGVTLLT